MDSNVLTIVNGWCQWIFHGHWETCLSFIEWQWSMLQMRNGISCLEIDKNEWWMRQWEPINDRCIRSSAYCYESWWTSRIGLVIILVDRRLISFNCVTIQWHIIIGYYAAWICRVHCVSLSWIYFSSFNVNKSKDEEWNKQLQYLLYRIRWGLSISDNQWKRKQIDFFYHSSRWNQCGEEGLTESQRLKYWS